MPKYYNEVSKRASLKYQQTLKQLHIKIKPEVYDDIAAYAKAKGLPIRQLILRAIEEYRENHPVQSQNLYIDKSLFLWYFILLLIVYN